MNPPRAIDRRLWLVLGVACALRLGYVLLCPQLPVVNDASAYDQEGYHIAFSQGVLQGNDGPIQISKGPVYPMLLAMIYRVVGHHHDAVRVVQALLSTLGVFLIYYIARLVLSHQVALAASALAAVYPPFISYAGLLLTETLSLVLLLAFAYSVAKGLSQPGIGWWACSGVCAGVLILHREATLPLVACLLVAMWRWRIRWSRLALLVGIAGLMILPWAVRNYQVYNTWVLVSPQQGPQMWISAYHGGWETWHFDDPVYQAILAQAGPDIVEQDRRLRAEGLKQIVEHPWRYLTLCLKRIPRLWVGGHSDTFLHLTDRLSSYIQQGLYLQASIKLTMLLYNLGVILLGFAGMGLAWKLGVADRRHLVVLSLPVAMTAVVHFFLFAVLRYQIPIMPFLIIFAGFTLCHVREVARDLVPVQATPSSYSPT